MSCTDSQTLIHPYVDGELDLVHALEIESHLKTCPGCGALYESELALRGALASGSLYYETPPALERRIRSALRKREPVRWFRPLALAAGSLAVAAAVLFLLVVRTPRPAESAIAQEVLASHVRSLMLNHLVDVPSSDQHTVKPWFAGKLDFSPPVKDLATAGFPLVGARLDYVDQRPVAALVYQRRAHRVNVFIWPAEMPGSAAAIATARQGYNLLHWTGSGMTFWAVSDLNRAELEQLGRLLR